MDALNSVTFDELLKECNPFAGGNCSFDLRDIRFISSAALVQLAAGASALSRNGNILKLLVEDDGVRSYLARSGFLSAVEGVVLIEPQYENLAEHAFDHLHGSNPLLLEVTEIEDGNSLPALLDRIVELLRTRMKYRKGDAYDLVTVISEVAQNTFDHNQGTFGFLALQTYKRRRGARFIEIGISDFGGGLRSTLARNPNLPLPGSDRDLVAYATHMGISEHQDPTRGTGLHHLLRIAYEHRGSVQIRSGSGKVKYRGDKRQGWRFVVPPMPGVHIAISLARRGT